MDFAFLNRLFPFAISRQSFAIAASAALALPCIARTVAPATWRQADFAAELYRHAAAAAGDDADVAVSPWGTVRYFADRLRDTSGDAAHGMAFALQLGGAETPAAAEVTTMFREADTALSRAARQDAAVAESGTNGTFRFSAKWNTAAAEVLETPLCSALRIPCAGGSFEMLAITPSPSNTIAEVEARLGRPFLDRLMAVPRSKPESMVPPAFGFRAIIDLNPILSPMGMAAFFAWNAVSQGVAISANAAGIEAAVATSADAADNPETLEVLDDPETPAPSNPLARSPSRPFLFLIRETRTGLILFIGRIAGNATTHADDSLVPAGGLKWHIPSGATIEDGILTIDVPPGESGMACATAPLDLSQCPDGFIAELKLVDNFPGRVRQKPVLNLGLQGCSGKVVFDLSSLRLLKAEPAFAKVNQDYVVAYPQGKARPETLRGFMTPDEPTEKDLEDMAAMGATLVRYQMTRNNTATTS